MQREWKTLAATLALTATLTGCIPALVLQQAQTVRDEGWWDRIAQCEVGGDWAMHGRIYSGIGFANSTYARYRYNWMPENAGDASPLEQIAVGERVRWELKPSGSLRTKWGCRDAAKAP